MLCLSLFTLSVVMCLIQAKAVPYCNRPVDIVFVLDSSHSILPTHFVKQLNFVQKLVQKFDIGPGPSQTRIGLLTFGHKVWRKFNLKNKMAETELLKSIKAIKHDRGRTTETAEAIEFARRNMFTAAAGSRQNVAHIAVVITDARSQKTRRTSKAAKKAQDTGIWMFAIGVGKRVDHQELSDIASDPDDRFKFMVDDFNALSSITEMLAEKACQVTKHPTLPPTTELPTTTTMTPAEHTDKSKEYCGGKSADVYFLIDSSRSITPSEFNKELQFVKDVVNIFDISPNKTRVGVIGFSNDAGHFLNLTNDLSKTELIKKIGQVRHVGRDTNTADALRMMRQDGFAPEVARPDIAQIAIVLTDGRSSDKKQTANESRIAHGLGIKVFAIGIGDAVDMVEIRNIASDPHDDYVFQVADVASLDAIKETLAIKTCGPNPLKQSVTQPPTLPSTTELPTTTAMTPAEHTDKSKEYCGGKSADVYFLIDSSGSITTSEFHRELQFVKDVVNIFDISPNKTRVGVIDFSDDAGHFLNLTNDLSKTELIKKIGQVRHVGGNTNTADALRMMRQDGFAPELARPDIAQIAIVLTDGRSSDKKQTANESRIAHELGIKVFAIGIGDGVYMAEVRNIASDPHDDYVFQVADVASLDAIKETLAIKTCGLKPMEQPACLVKTNTALIFTYDSAALGEAKSRIISEFIAEIVSKLDLTGRFLKIGRITENCITGANLDLSNRLASADFAEIHFSSFGHLLKRIRWTIFSSGYGARKGSPSVTVMFVDSDMQGLDKRAIHAAKTLSQDSELYVIAIGHGPITEKFSNQTCITGRNFIQILSYDALTGLHQAFLNELCYFFGTVTHTIY